MIILRLVHAILNLCGFVQCEMMPMCDWMELECDHDACFFFIIFRFPLSRSPIIESQEITFFTSSCSD